MSSEELLSAGSISLTLDEFWSNSYIFKGQIYASKLFYFCLLTDLLPQSFHIGKKERVELEIHCEKTIHPSSGQSKTSADHRGKSLSCVDNINL